MRRPVQFPAAGLAAVLLATFLVYAPSLANGFTMDDRLVAMGANDAGYPNLRIDRLQPLGTYFSTPYWGDSNDRDVHYRPLTILSFALRHRLFGDAAWPEHLANVLLHLLATALVYTVLRTLLVGPGAALLGASLFGLHAVHSEVVANVVGRAELLAFTLGAGALVLWQWGEGAGRRDRLLRWSGSGLLLFGAFSSKESAVAWVGFFLVFALARRWRGSDEPIHWSEMGGLCLRVAVVAAVPLALFLLLRHRMLAAQGGAAVLEVADLVNPIFAAPTSVRIFTATWVLAYGLLLVVAPFRLAADYSIAVFEVIQSALHWKFLVAGGALLAAGLAALRLRRRHPLLFLGASAFFGFALMTSNLLFPIGTIFGERMLYAPSLGLSLLGAWAWEASGLQPARRSALLFVTGLWLGASSLVILQRNPLWQDDATLFLHEARSQPRSVRMQVNAASIHHARGELETAAHHLERALELDPEHALSWNNLAAIHLEQGRLGEAELAARRGLEAEHVVPAHDLYKLRCNLGLVLLRRERPREGAEELGHCLQLEPAFLRPWRELVALEGRGVLEVQELEAIIEEGEGSSPDPSWGLYRGLLANHRGRWAEAVQSLEGALAVTPRTGPSAGLRAEARLALVEALVRLGREDEARSHARGLAEDRFAPLEQRQLAGEVAAALDQAR